MSVMRIVLPDIDLLTQAEEIELAKAIEVGVFAERVLRGGGDHQASEAELRHLSTQGAQAWQRFFSANLRLVLAIAQPEAARCGCPLEELFQEGCVGLGEALMRWDFQRGTRFSTLAWKTVGRAVWSLAMLRGGQIDAPLGRVREQRRLRRLQDRLAAQAGRSISSAELAQAVGRSSSWVDARLAVGAATKLSELPAEPVEETPWPSWRWDAPLDGWLARLSPLEREVIAQRFGWRTGKVEPRAAIGGRLGISEATVRRVEDRVLRRARRFMDAQPRSA